MQLNQEHMRDLSLKTLATVGIVVLLVVGAWGVVIVARNIPNVFSGLGAAVSSVTSIFTPAERLEITMESANVESGVPFSLSWKHVNKRGVGSYTILFACRDGLSVEAPTARGTYEKVACDTPFNFENAQEHIRLIATSIRSRFLDVPFTISFTRLEDGIVAATTEMTLTVINEEVSGTTLPVTPSTPTPARTPTSPRIPGGESRSNYVLTPCGHISDPSGRPDLSVRILSLGTLDRSTNAFTPGAGVLVGSRAAIRFEIENVGTRTAEYWYFNASLPSWPFHIFHGDAQRSLGPGDKIEYTLGFDAIDNRATGGVITINADPANSLFEPSESNNIAKAQYTILF